MRKKMQYAEKLKIRHRRKRAQFIFSLAIRMWRWERERGISCSWTPVFEKTAAICLYVTKDSIDNLTWHNRAFRFYTSGQYIDYFPKCSEESIIEEIREG